MKFRFASKAYTRKQHKSWHRFFAIWPRRVSEMELAVGPIMRRIKSDAYEYRTLDEHARTLLINGTRVGDPWYKSEMERYTKLYQDSMHEEADDE